MRSLLPIRRLAAAAGLALLVTACGTSSATTSDDTTAAPASPSATATDSATAQTSATATVDANHASADELVAAFEAAGVSNAERWADEVEEYRPYPTDDPELTTLQQELQKYNPGDQTLQRILSVLTV